MVIICKALKLAIAVLIAVVLCEILSNTIDRLNQNRVNQNRGNQNRLNQIEDAMSQCAAGLAAALLIVLATNVVDAERYVYRFAFFSNCERALNVNVSWWNT